MHYQTINLGGRDYVVLPREDYDKLAGRSVAGMALPPLPEADAHGRLPALAAARVNIARSIITRMNALGVTQAELSRASSVPTVTLNRILKATRTPDESTLTKLEKAFTKLDKK